MIEFFDQTDDVEIQTIVAHCAFRTVWTSVRRVEMANEKAEMLSHVAARSQEEKGSRAGLGVMDWWVRSR